VVVQLLLSGGRADPTARDNYAMCWSSAAGHTEVMQLLLEDPPVASTHRD